MYWLVLILSGVLEAIWATALGRSEGFTRLGPTAVFAVALAASMAGLAYAMRGLPIGTAYAVWVGIGAALTAGWAMWSGQEPTSVVRVLLLGGHRRLRRRAQADPLTASVEAEHLVDRPPAADGGRRLLGRVAHPQQHLRMADQVEPRLQAGAGRRPVQRLGERRGGQPSTVASSSTRASARPACSQSSRSSSSVPMSTTVGRSTSGGGASGSPAGRKSGCCSRSPTTKSRISQFDGRACGSSPGTASTGTPSTAPGSVRIQLCSSARYAGSPCSISSAREIRKTVATSSSERAIGLTQVRNRPASSLEAFDELVGDRARQERGPHGVPRSIARGQRGVLLGAGRCHRSPAPWPGGRGGPVGQQGDVRSLSSRRQGDDGELDGDTAADDLLAAGRVEHRQGPLGVEEDIEPVTGGA